MRYPPGQKEKTRTRILSSVSRGFRMHGYGGIGVDGLAKEAGLTSGAFYGHFKSKEAAFREAVETGLEEYRAGVDKFRAEHGDAWVGVFVPWYMSAQRRQDLAEGCALPALSPEVVRADRSIHEAYEAALGRLTAAVADGLPPGDPETRTAEARALLALLAGGITLARAVADPEEADRVAASITRSAIAIASGRLRGAP